MTAIAFSDYGRRGPGTHSVTVRARDRGGNLSAPSSTITVVVP